LVLSQFKKGGLFYETSRLARDPYDRRLSVLYRRALKRGRWLLRSAQAAPETPLDHNARPSGISVVIPSRNGVDLLRGCLPRVEGASEIIVVVNGSNDGTTELLAHEFPAVLIEQSTDPLSFARAVNRGVARARFSHVCLLNNDMLVEPNYLPVL